MTEPIIVAHSTDDYRLGPGGILIPAGTLPFSFDSLPVRRDGDWVHVNNGAMSYVDAKHAGVHAAYALAALVEYSKPEADPRREAVRALVDAIDGVGASEDDITAIIEAATEELK